MLDKRAEFVLPKVLATQAEKLPDHIFIQIEDFEQETYRQCYERSLRVASGLAALQIKKEEKVVIMAPTSFSFIHSWFAVNILGAVEVSINTAYRGQSLVHVLNNSTAQIMLIDTQFLQRLQDVEEELLYLKKVIYFGDSIGADLPEFHQIQLIPFKDIESSSAAEIIPSQISYNDPASIIYTSGTTGPSKGVVMPHGQISLLAQNAVAGFKLSEYDVYHVFLPLFHMAGKYMMLYAAMVAGCKVVIDRKFDPENWLSRVRKYGATISGGHGPFLEMIYRQPEQENDIENPLRAIFAAPFPSRIAQAFERRFAVKGIELWGMTEINCPCYRPYDEALRPGSSGKVLTEWYEVKIVDPLTDEEVPAGEVGEIVVRSKHPWTIMQGYFGMPEKTAEAWRNLWFHTGDMAYFDSDGYMYFVDRLKDKIRRKAENISSFDIESAVNTHPLILESAAVGVASQFDADDEIKVYAVIRPGASLQPKELIEYLVDLLPHYMVPNYIEYIEQLPRTITNKVQKAKLRQLGITDNTWSRKTAGVSVRKLIELKNLERQKL